MSAHPAASSADPTTPIPTLVIYRLKKSKQEEFLPLLKEHWPTLSKLGLVSQDLPRYWRGLDERHPEKVSFIELFGWKDRKASDDAHQTPEVMAMWERMTRLLEGLEVQAVEALRL